MSISEILEDNPDKPDQGQQKSTALLIIEHPDYLLRWVPTDTSYITGETRPLKAGVRRLDGLLVDAPTAATVTVFDGAGDSFGPFPLDLESGAPALEAVCAYDYAFSGAGGYIVKFAVTIGPQNLIYEQALYIGG